MSKLLKVFLLDDHELVRRGLASLISNEEDLIVVGEAGTAREALELIPVCLPDVAVLDVRLPDGDGVEVCRELRSNYPTVSCLMLTSFAEDDALASAVLAGASGYLLKQIRGNDLINSIRHVGHGRSLISTSDSSKAFDLLRTNLQSKTKLETLTSQESKILDLISQGMTNKQIAETLFLAEKTVKNYVSHLLAKLGMKRRSEAAAYAARLSEKNKRN